MSATLDRPLPPAADRDHARVATATWFIATILGCAAGIVTGLMWDISWHMTVGRDTFWSPPHVLEYLSGVTAGLSCGYVVLRTTYAGSAEDKGVTVGFWGFRGPLGAWITIWGTFAMLVSAPFDDWWHNAYGLDVKIVSPPHMILLLGMLGIVIGALVLTVSAQNRSAGEVDEVRDAWLYAAAGGVLCFILGCATIEYSWPNAQHWPFYYQVWAGVFPALLVGYSRAGRLKWPATSAALVFMLIWLGMGLLLRTVDAAPKLGPIFNPRTYMWPPYFPAWLVVPAFGIDLVLKRFKDRNAWLVAGALGATFVLLQLAAQWPWSSFMLTGASHNWFFNGGEFPYMSRLGDGARQQFWTGDRGVIGGATPMVLARGMLIAAAIGALSSRLGLAWGGWMARVKR